MPSSTRSFPSPMVSLYRPPMISASPAYAMSGAVATGSVLNFLRKPSLSSTGLLGAGLVSAGLFYGGGKGTQFGLEDGPWVSAAASSICAAVTVPTAIRTLRPAPIILSAAAIGVGAYYIYEGLEEGW
ncbi:hypothetical protein [Phaffia rhodozyma]|uniref:Uncharacterized protein n=1 Tax=Phaffia rhodozyma TaxID=264483 RepID=A0A0F7SPZ8_PHARH|nr:hypothetical protein [Phaffia rhodozyma]